MKQIQLKEKWVWLTKRNCASFILLLQVHTLGILYSDENDVLLPITTWKNITNIIQNEKRHLQEHVSYNSMYVEIKKGQN